MKTEKKLQTEKLLNLSGVSLDESEAVIYPDIGRKLNPLPKMRNPFPAKSHPRLGPFSNVPL